MNRNSLKRNTKTDDFGRSLLDMCISSQCRILNGRTLGDTEGKPTSYQYNGSAVVDYSIISQSLINHISYFKVEEFTIHSDHSQITTCLNLNISRQEDKLGRPPPVGLKWSKLTEKLFQEKIISPDIERLLQNVQLTIRENNAEGINEAASELSSIFKQISSDINTHSKLALQHTKKRKTVRKHKKWFDQDGDTLYRNLKSTARSLTSNCNDTNKLKN